jgi:hypothetical protein
MPALIAFGAVYLFSVDMLFYDDFLLAPAIARLYHGQLTFGELISRYNEHRIFFPRLIIFALGYLTRFDPRYVCLVSVAILAATSFVLYRLCRSTLGESSWRVPFIWTNLFIFGLIQSENLVSSFNISWFLVNLSIVGAVAVASSSLRPVPKIVWCAVFAALGTYSMGSGMGVWIFASPLLFTGEGIRGIWSRKKYAFAWLVLSGLAIGTYFVGAPGRDDWKPIVSPTLARPGLIHAPGFFLAMLGTPFTAGLTRIGHIGAVVLGALLLAAFLAAAAYCWRNRSNPALIKAASPWLAIGGFALSVMLVIVASRMRQMKAGPHEFRYTTNTLLLIVSVICLAAVIQSHRSRIAVQSPSGKTHRRLLTAALVVLYICSTSAGMARLYFWWISRTQGKVAYIFLNSAPPRACLYERVWQGDPEELSAFANILNNLGLLRPPLLKTANVRDLEAKADLPKRYGAFESISPGDRGQYIASGWAVSPDRGVRADAVLLTRDDPDGTAHLIAVAENRDLRPDIIKARKNPLYAFCGWRATVDPADLHGMRLRAWAFDLREMKAHELEGAPSLPEATGASSRAAPE